MRGGVFIYIRKYLINVINLSPPFAKGGWGDFMQRFKIPLNPPFSKGDFKAKLYLG